MSISNFEIQLADNRTVWIPGQRLEGFIALTTTKPIEVQLLRVRFVGKVATFLTKSEAKYLANDFSITNESSTVTLFKDFTNLVGDFAGDPVMLRPDEYVYPFQFRLPSSSIPCSFEVCFVHDRVHGETFDTLSLQRYYFVTNQEELL
jgi:hypothetical protein